MPLLKRLAICLVNLFLFLLVSAGVRAQKGHETFIDSLSKKIEYYRLKKQEGLLYAHFDKTVYVDNESVWFTAYLLNYNKRINDPSILSAILINENDRSIVLERQFTMANGLAFGHVFIPDTVPPGDYSFLVYTNELKNGMPIDVFIQPITVKTTSMPTLVASVSVLDTGKAVFSSIRKVQLKATTQDGKPIFGAEVSYHIGGNQHPVISGKITTDKDGQYLLSAPANQIVAGDNVLMAKVSYKKEVSNIKIALPLENKLNVRFYPEGGSLVHGAQSIIGWEVKNVYGAPMAVSGVLLKDNTPVDTIFTDSHGIGKFTLVPLIGSNYKLKIASDLKDTTYQLPPILARGPVLSLKKAIVNDSLQIRVVSKYPAEFFLMVHNYRQSFFIFPVEASSAGKTVLVILKDVPKGLNTLTVLDTKGRPVAERIFFAHYNQRTPISITTDRANYTTRQKITLKLKLDASGTDTIRGMVSVACVQRNRIEQDKANDIESYFYLKNELESIPSRKEYMGQNPAAKAWLENVLLIKGWRRYTWQEMVETTAKDTINRPETLSSFYGLVRNSDKLIKKTINVMVTGDSTTQIITTDQNGRFTLDRNTMTTAEGRKVRLLLGNNSDYSLSIKNPFTTIDSLLVKGFRPQNYDKLLTNEITTNSLVLTDLKHTINLKEVIIKGAANRREDGSLYSSAGPNECGDYVCRYNILNCPIHLNEDDNRPAIKGGIYGILVDNLASTVINGEVSFLNTFTNHQNETYQVMTYLGCKTPKKDPTMIAINGINYSKQFYTEDYSHLNPSEPEYQSTIYWKNLCFVNSKGDVELSFYTSDITGPFKIIVQGVCNNDVVTGEATIVVGKQ